MVSFVSKGLLPYHGLVSGFNQALEKWPAIDFSDDGCLFTAAIRRKGVEELELMHTASEGLPKNGAGTGKRRESVGKDSRSLSGKPICYHSRVGRLDWYYRAIGAKKHPEPAKGWLIATDRREEGRPLGGD